MTNLLEAICNIIESNNFEIKAFYISSNRANNMGDALEEYVKDAFANTFNYNDEQERISKHSDNFSWTGSQNNPPDIIIKGSDAIEVKKSESKLSTIPLNSSYPKSILKSDDPMISEGCRKCETWSQKDLIYCMGHTNKNKLKSMWLFYGNIYSAKKESYERIKKTISSGISEISDVVFSETKELGRINNIDPLGITSLRIRGMWQIENPRKVFKYLYNTNIENDFELVSIIPKKKWNKFPKQSKQRIKDLNLDSLVIEDLKIKDPNNPASLIDVKVIKYSLAHKI